MPVSRTGDTMTTSSGDHQPAAGHDEAPTAPSWHELFHASHTPGPARPVLSGWVADAVECATCGTLLYSDRGPSTTARAYRRCEGGRPRFARSA